MLNRPRAKYGIELGCQHGGVGACGGGTVGEVL